MESRKQLHISRAMKKPEHCAGAWATLWKAKRKTFLIKAGLDWWNLEGLDWRQFSQYQQVQILGVLSEYPEPGPMFGLLPANGRDYRGGWTVAEAYANHKAGEPAILSTVRTEEQQAYVKPEDTSVGGSNVVNFGMYKRRVA